MSHRNPLCQLAGLAPRRMFTIPGMVRLLPLLTLALAGCGVGGDEGAPSTSTGGWTGEGILVIEGATVLTSPASVPMVDAQVVIANGVIEAVGERGSLSLPANVRRVSGIGGFLVAGLHDLDVRLTPEILDAAADPATPGAVLEAWLADNFLRYGFTFILETGSSFVEIQPLLDRIQQEGLRAPALLATGGTPLADLFPGGEMLPDLGTGIWDELLADDVSVVSSLSLLLPDPEVHGEPGSPPFSAQEARWEAGTAALGTFARAGGRVVFGSGFGWGALVDPLMEVESLERAGLDMAAILAALTTEPALRMGRGDRGEVEPGMVADLILLDGDPFADPSVFERVRWVLRSGVPVFGTVR